MTDMLNAPAWTSIPPPVEPNGHVERRTVRGLRLTRVPSGSLLAQVVGVIAVLAGVFLLWGVGVFLLVGGIMSVVGGMLHEAGLLSPAEKA